ncbi:MAG: hypothetical protein AVDCRST_MAG77-4745 [uncultured Chloroflexi bacterium]|uniref:Helix-turn-helix domain-containing protein n=1 Tax=uncultured Chloroflexota bacterium TaxID=166587 RepID=A0A6J4JZE2_9CHLR|nr:MAG: hypothetical protein AVDCRST_MAG77-4745 [uncultured Chloroflexota bacterium]
MQDRIEAIDERTVQPAVPATSDADSSSGAAGMTGASGLPATRMFLTAHEVGQQLGIRKSRVYELAATGLLPVVRLGRRMLFPRRGLEQLAQAAINRAVAEALSDRVTHGLSPAPRVPTQRATRTTGGGRSQAARGV